MERDEEYKKKNVWIDQGFLKLGPSGKEKAEYSLNTTKNKEIDMYRKSLAGSQSVTSTARSRRKIEGEAISYGGRVSWEKEKDDKRKIVLPMTKAEYEKLGERVAKLTDDMNSTVKNENEKYRKEDMLSAVVVGDDIHFSGNKLIGYTKYRDIRGSMTQGEADKIGDNMRTPLEANRIIKQLGKEISRIKSALRKAK